MAKYNIEISNTENDMSGTSPTVENRITTNGFVILFLDKGQIEVLGRVEFSEIAPYLMKLAVEKFVK